VLTAIDQKLQKS